MADIVTPEKRSRMMAGIRRKDTKPEILVRKALFAAGYRFRLHRRDLPGAPDVVMPGRMLAIFVHGCFWHAHRDCRLAKTPTTNVEFWQAKLAGNVARDCRAIAALRSAGWRVLVVWECATRGEAAAQLAEQLKEWITGNSALGEIP
ncbi:very short patch repair endonuclease [Ralstonia pseudosolanacearum]|uniref:very short patch repair endonuclease n=1 Tax=Ralstonia pseudosolanacearum TaxID=1310165 RepID=UPI0009E2F9B0|nr:DNA mismatch endonuclease Vsr [Ralstonia pseudosolanacearum]